MTSPTKLVAFFLPQFHPTPENDAWWGPGFTEWTNVTKAGPLFPGHHQPHLPTEMGFYDLRLRETRRAQIRLARSFGIDAFCYHYYWFSGRRLLHEPLDDMLADPGSDMPFCLCWANENWTRAWDGAEQEILIAQKYRPEDDLNFIRDIAPFLKDPRYLRVDGAPFLIVYRPQHLSDPRKTLAVWREYCAGIGIPRLHLAATLTHNNWDASQFGFDSGVHFPPHNLTGVKRLNRTIPFCQPFEGLAIDFAAVAQHYLDQKPVPGTTTFRTVFPSWDNTARRGSRGLIILNGTPQNYEYWLAETLRLAEQEHPGPERLVFINAWNEWAEGCHLEPCRRYGRGFLEATRRARDGERRFTGFVHTGLPPGTQATRRGLIAKVGRQITRPVRRLSASREAPAANGEAARRYLDLMQAVLIGAIDQDPSLNQPADGPEALLRHRQEGTDWPSRALTMIGAKRLGQFRAAVTAAIEQNVPGDIMETGVWRGGACIMARAVLAAYCVSDRRVILADSFAGLPPPDPERYPADAGADLHTYPELAVPLATVKANFARFDLLDDQVRFLPGWFRDTLPAAPTDRLAVLRLDGDLYESTTQALTHLYPKVSPGGWVIIDDYGAIPACRSAVHDYLAANRIVVDLAPIDWTGVFFRKPAA